MRTWGRGLAVILLVGLAGTARTDDKDGAANILDKAIKATGGEAKLAKLTGLTLKGGGVFYDGDKKTTFTGTWQTQGADKGRFTIVTDVKGAKITEIRVVNGDKGWSKTNDKEAEAMDKDTAAEEKEGLYFNWVTTLVPLKGKDFKLTALPEIKVAGKPAVGFTVAAKGHRDVKLYFDKDSGLLVRAERKVRDVDAKKDYTEEVLFSDYKDFDGVKVALKYTTKWDGKPQADAEMTEAKLQEKLDDALFNKP